MRYLYIITATLLASVWLSTEAKATHLRAGEIIAVRDSLNPFKYYFTLTTYTDNVGGVQANDAQDEVVFYFGDELAGQTGTPASRDNGNGTRIGTSETSVNYYKTDHVFSGNGVYSIRVGIQNRNAGVINLGNNSSDISFFVATTILINQQLGFNQTPILKNPPLDQACVGQRFIHNPAAWDKDGDSISYRLTQPREVLSDDRTGTGILIPGYQDPANGPTFIGGQNEAKNAPASFSINATKGDLIWDAPAKPGEYNVAFTVVEWRNGIAISEIIRDMQIIVKDCNDKRPQLIIPNDTCVAAGYKFQNVLITATDPDNNPITITSDTTSSGVYGPDFPLPLATFTPSVLPQPQPSTPNPASGRFNWQTSCNHIRQQPYSILFKAEDNPPPVGSSKTVNKLTDLKTWRITVVGPKPETLKGVPNAGTKSVTLTWKSYSCQLPGAQIFIWRKVGCGYEPGPCETGLSPSSGYVIVNDQPIPVSDTTFTDTNRGLGLDPGVTYSYRISVGFAPPSGGASLASDEVCVSFPIVVPVITHVTVEVTNKAGGPNNGKITVKWLRPLDLDLTTNPGPYTYRLSRAIGQSGTNFTPVFTTTFSEFASGITSFKDSLLNTRDLSYRYRLEFTSTPNQVKPDSSNAASSVRLDSLPVVNAVNLSWQAHVPWSNDNQTHIVYRERRNQPGVFNIIAQVPVLGSATFQYRDDGIDRFQADGIESFALSADSVYCYKVTTVGTYGNPLIKPNLLLNDSQEICASPRDTVRPCIPVLTIDDSECIDYYVQKEVRPTDCNGPYANQLTWTYPTQDAQGIKCKEAVKYNLYYTRYEGEAFNLLSTIPAPEMAFTHKDISSYAGCYYVTAVSRSGNESLPSKIVCKDNCPYYELPNVFTPNGDGQNDKFEPFHCPQFVESVNFVVYNRWGRKVFESDRNIMINWDGRLGSDADTQGKELASWVYYYIAKVKFQRLRRQDEWQTIKGWVQILK
ncbi:MAG: gliding motility-associated C-terminal domain-containing protein [Bacteroidota bacterium]